MNSAKPESDTDVPRYYHPAPARRLTLTRERIRQIETVAMRKMRREFVRRGIGKNALIG